MSHVVRCISRTCTISVRVCSKNRFVSAHCPGTPRTSSLYDINIFQYPAARKHLFPARRSIRNLRTRAPLARAPLVLGCGSFCPWGPVPKPHPCDLHPFLQTMTCRELLIPFPTLEVQSVTRGLRASERCTISMLYIPRLVHSTGHILFLLLYVSRLLTTDDNERKLQYGRSV